MVTRIFLVDLVADMVIYRTRTVQANVPVLAILNNLAVDIEWALIDDLQTVEFSIAESFMNSLLLDYIF